MDIFSFEKIIQVARALGGERRPRRAHGRRADGTGALRGHGGLRGRPALGGGRRPRRGPARHRDRGPPRRVVALASDSSAKRMNR